MTSCCFHADPFIGPEPGRARLRPSRDTVGRTAARREARPTEPRFRERLLRLVVPLVIGLCPVRAQSAAAEEDDAAKDHMAIGAPDATTGEDWAFSASALAYFVPEDRNYVQPTITADRGTLHLEARYNYEAPETGSAWLGVNFGDEGTLRWEVTPMLGGVFGDTTGIASGVRGLVGWRALELSVEGEYVMDMGDAAGSFLYLWSELTVSPLEWFRVGVASQRTRAYRSELDVQRGFTIGFTYRALDLAAYVFNPDVDEPTVVVAVSVELERARTRAK